MPRREQKHKKTTFAREISIGLERQPHLIDLIEKSVVIYKITTTTQLIFFGFAQQGVDDDEIRSVSAPYRSLISDVHTTKCGQITPTYPNFVK